MSAFIQSGRSIDQCSAILTGSFRPEAATEFVNSAKKVAISGRTSSGTFSDWP